MRCRALQIVSRFSSATYDRTREVKVHKQALECFPSFLSSINFNIFVAQTASCCRLIDLFKKCFLIIRGAQKNVNRIRI
jgi:hypothetical protein